MGSYGARVRGGIVGVIGGRDRPRVSADSTAIANCGLRLLPTGPRCQARPRHSAMRSTTMMPMSRTRGRGRSGTRSRRTGSGGRRRGGRSLGCRGRGDCRRHSDGRARRRARSSGVHTERLRRERVIEQGTHDDRARHAERSEDGNHVLLGSGRGRERRSLAGARWASRQELRPNDRRRRRSRDSGERLGACQGRRWRDERRVRCGRTRGVRRARLGERRERHRTLADGRLDLQRLRAL